MSLLWIHRFVRRRRNHGVTVVVAAAAAFLIALHHAPSMPQASHHDSGAVIVETCAAAFVAVGVAFAVAFICLVGLRWGRRSVAVTADGTSEFAASVVTRTRAGPEVLSLLCVSRR